MPRSEDIVIRLGLPKPRQEDARRAYVEGFETGYQQALIGIRHGASPDEVQDRCASIAALCRRTLPDAPL